MATSNYSYETYINIKIKSTISDNDTFDLNISERSTIENLKTIILNKLNTKKESKAIRLIYCGKLLKPDNKCLQDFKIENNSFIHAVITQARVENTITNSNNNISDDNDDGNHEANNNTTNSRGFDQLLRNGFSRNEVSFLRSAFRQPIIALSGHIPRRNDETDESYHYRIEERFMDSQRRLTTSSFNLTSYYNTDNMNNEINDTTSFLNINNDTNTSTNNHNSEEFDDLGTYKDFFMGYLIGFTIGFIVIFCIWDRNLSHRQKVGLLCGLASSTLLEMYSQEKLPSSSSSSSSTHEFVDHNSLRGSRY